ncbi:MAG: glutaredoxin family protein [Anaerolineales bacterium]|nr:glutaredoxin family protein [Anaerolineales bacterium]
MKVTLFTKAGCHLCEDVEAALAALQTQYPHKLVTVDITTDEALFARYRFTIPVVRVGDVELSAPITAVQLAQLLASPK